MIATVTRGSVRAWSTIGILTGVLEDGREVDFAADHRPARNILEALDAGETVEVEVDDYLVLAIRDPEEAETHEEVEL